MELEINPFAEQTEQEEPVKNDDGLALEELVHRIAEIEDELVRLGVSKLLDEQKSLRDTLKALMMLELKDRVIDESSNWEAVLTVPLTDAWDVSMFTRVLSEAQRQRYIVPTVDTGAVAQGVKIGDLSRVKLEVAGAVQRIPKNSTPTLNVKPRKGGETE